MTALKEKQEIVLAGLERSFDPVRSPEELRQRLSRDPLQVAKDQTGKYDTIPVSVLEYTMDWVFGPGMWGIVETTFEDKGPIGKTSTGKTMIGLVTIVSVRAVHPVLDFQTTQTGISSGFYTYGKFSTAFAAEQKLAFKNACKKWGKVFGRDLNRNIVEGFSDELNIESFRETFFGCKSLKELHVLYVNTTKGMSKEDKDAITAIFTEAKNQLQKNSKGNGKEKV